MFACCFEREECIALVYEELHSSLSFLCCILALFFHFPSSSIYSFILGISLGGGSHRGSIGFFFLVRCVKRGFSLHKVVCSKESKARTACHNIIHHPFMRITSTLDCLR
ncbi:unnamed protein product [Victoria cruziana]